MALTPDIKIRGIRTPIPSGYVLGRTQAGHGDVHLIPIDKVGGVSGVGGGGGGGGGGGSAGSGAGGGAGSSSSSGGTGTGGGTGGSISNTAAVNQAIAIANAAMGLAAQGSEGVEGDDGAPGPPGPQGPAGTATVNSGILGLVFVFDGGGVAPAATSTADMYVPFACTITGAVMQGDVSGSAVIDVWAKAYAATAPAVGNTIVASAPPTLSAVQNSKDTTLTGWTTAIAADSVVRASLTSASTLTRVTLTLAVTK